MSEPKPQYSRRGRIVHVTDGDTVVFEYTTRVKVRLLGIDAPEITRAKDKEELIKGRMAKERLDEILDGREVILVVPLDDADSAGDTFSFSRVLGKIYYRGDNNEWVDVSEQLISEGHAVRM